MKIVAEFNSNEELSSFINTFGAKTIATGQAVIPVAKETVTSDKSEVKEEGKKEDAPKVDAEVVGTDQKTSEVKDAEGVKEEDKKEDPKITKEMVRALFTKLIKAGKQKEAMDITKKYGASKLPDLAEEHYVAAYKDAEALL